MLFHILCSFAIKSNSSTIPSPSLPFSYILSFFLKKKLFFLQFQFSLPFKFWVGVLSSMKFGKRLKQQIEETLPAWRDKFLSYKELKKLVRLISSAESCVEYGKADAQAEFVHLLNNEIDKFNVFFMEQEEDFIIRHKVSLFTGKLSRTVLYHRPTQTMMII